MNRIYLCATSLFVRIGMFPIFTRVITELRVVHRGPNEVLQNTVFQVLQGLQCFSAV